MGADQDEREHEGLPVTSCALRLLFAGAPLAAVIGAAVSAEAADIAEVQLASDHVALDGRVEARIDLAGQYTNPFDPGEIRVDARIALPNGETREVPAFWNRDTTRSLEDGREVIAATGPGFFQIRYAPEQEGAHELTIVAADGQGQSTSAMMRFEVGPGKGRGFVRVDPTDTRALVYEDGTPYVPVGANVCWSNEASAGLDMEAYLEAIAGGGGTWSRLWMTHFGEGWTLEWGEDHPTGYYEGLGRYSLEVASRLDRVFEAAESLGIAIQLVLWQHSQLEADMWSSWDENPYNAANGGPAENSRAFFEHPTAVDLSRRRLRYLVARYAAYRSLFAWEIMNEMDGSKVVIDVVSSWCEARARDLRAMDPHRHLVTTSLMLRPYLVRPEAYASDAYDISQAHAYGGSFGFAIPRDADALAAFGKPAVFGEFGLDFLGEVEQRDPRGVHLAEGSWIALASGYWSGAMSWWWDSYLRPNDLFDVQAGFASFVRNVDVRGMHEPVGDDVAAEGDRQTALEVFGRTGPAGSFLYVRHPDARWEVASTEPMPWVNDGRVRGVCPGPEGCVVTFFDTGSGEQTGEPVAIEERSGWVALPAFEGSIAVVIRPGPGNQAASVEGGCGCALERKAPAAAVLPILLLAALCVRRRVKQYR